MGTARFLSSLSRTMLRTCIPCVLALGLSTAAPRPLAAQKAALQLGAAPAAAHQITWRSIPYRELEAAPDRTAGLVVPPRTDAAGRRRAWWLLPAAGAGAGAILGHLAVSSTDCSTCESTRPWQPAATGAVLGVLAGAAFELTLRSLGR